MHMRVAESDFYYLVGIGADSDVAEFWAGRFAGIASTSAGLHRINDTLDVFLSALR